MNTLIEYYPNRYCVCGQKLNQIKAYWFYNCKNEFGIYVKGLNQYNPSIVWLYMDDLLIARRIHNDVENIKFNPRTEFDQTKLIS